MNKIEEIYNRYDYLARVETDSSLIDYKGNMLKALKEFGKICFEAGSELVWKSTGDYSGYESYKYKTYEDFLKEIEDGQ